MQTNHQMRELSLTEIEAVAGGKSVTVTKAASGNTYYVGKGFFSIKLNDGTYVQLNSQGEVNTRPAGQPL